MALFQVQTVNGQKQLTPMTGGVPDGSVGSLIMKYKKIQPKNCLYCDGRDTTGTDEELRIYYPALYMYLGSNVLPDYRECTMVGAEQNTTDTIATHDVYAQGEFKDDQMQNITLRMRTTAGGEGNSIAMTGASTIYDRKLNDVSISGRFGNTTHSKQKAVYVYIVAVDSVVVSDDESFLRVVENYIDEKNSYSETETLTGGTWIDGKPIYRKVINFGTLPNNTEKTVNHNISNLDTLIKMECIAKSASGAMNIPYINIRDSSASVSIFYNTTNIAIRTSYDRSAYRAIVILEYTKTT